MAIPSSTMAALSRLIDRTRIPDPTLQRHAVGAIFRHLISLPAPLPAAAHEAPQPSSLRPTLQSPRTLRPLSPVSPPRAPISSPQMSPSRSSSRPSWPHRPPCSPPASSRQSPRSQPAPSAPALASRPTTTPFIQALASGADGARAELMR
jgi:hypothetical protein